MRLAALLLPITCLLTCTKETFGPPPCDPVLLHDVLTSYVKQDSLQIDGKVAPGLRAYYYYDPVYSKDGLEAPPPLIDSGQYMHESRMIEMINLDQYFSSKKDSEHVKYQITNSIRLCANLRIDSLLNVHSAKISDNEELSFYLFYTPIFNNDSSAAYVQYDFKTSGVYSYGNGAVFLKESDDWTMIKWIPIWGT